MWYQAYPKFLKMTSLLHSGTLFGLDTSPRFIRLPPKKYDRPSTTELELSLQLLLVASSRIMGAPKNLELASITWVCWVVLGLQSPLSNSLLIVQECDIITSSHHHWMQSNDVNLLSAIASEPPKNGLSAGCPFTPKSSPLPSEKPTGGCGGTASPILSFGSSQMATICPIQIGPHVKRRTDLACTWITFLHASNYA